MIQRIQTIYLLMVMLLMAVLCFLPLFDFTGSDQLISTFSTMGIESSQAESHTWGVLTIAALAAIVPLINIFLFKKRKLQIKLCHLTTFLIIFFYVTVAAYLYAYTNKNGIDIFTIGIQPHIALTMPLIALIFNLLSIKRIKKDEKLIRSLDRIR